MEGIKQLLEDSAPGLPYDVIPETACRKRDEVLQRQTVHDQDIQQDELPVQDSSRGALCTDIADFGLAILRT